MQTLEEQAYKTQNKEIDKFPKMGITLNDATMRDDVNSIANSIPTYRSNPMSRFAKGAIAAYQSMYDIAPAIEIYGRQADIAIGGYFGAKPETIQRKALNLATSYRNFQAEQQKRYEYAVPEDLNSWAYGLGQGAFNYGLMLVGGGAVGGGVKALGATAAKQVAAKTAAGLTANVLLENVEQQSERMPLNEMGEVDVNQITPEWARKSTIGATSYLAVSTILEKGFGFGKQVKMWETPIKTSNKAIKVSSPVVKMAAKSALSEGMTEGLQSLTSTGILLAEGKINVEQLPDRLKDAWKEAVIGGILGGTAGSAVAINQAHNVKTMLNEQISKVVTDPDTREQIVDAIYESGTAEMTNVISKELELSSELNTKHGAIYDTMQGAIYDAINNAGAFQGVEEAEIAQYVSDTSKMFANQVLAEANKRGVLIDEVLKASDIKFENGKIYMQAGKEIIAETPAVSEETNAEIVEEETEQETQNEYIDFNNLKDDSEKLNYIQDKFGRGSKKLAVLMLKDGLTAPSIGNNNMYSIGNTSITKAQYNKALKIYEFLNNARNNAYDTAFGNIVEMQGENAKQNNNVEKSENPDTETTSEVIEETTKQVETETKQKDKKETNKKSDETKIEDVGEFLLGNRKENPALTWKDLEEMNELLRAKNTTKAKIYPKPTMDGLKADGFTEFQAAIILNIYNKINAKPASGYTSKEDLKLYVDTVNNTMKTVKDYIKSNPDNFSAEKYIQEQKEYQSFVFKYDKSLFDAVFPDTENKKETNRYSSIFRLYPEYNKQAIIVGGNKFTEALQLDYRTLKNVTKIINEEKTKTDEKTGEKIKKPEWEKTFILLEPSRWDNSYAIAFKKSKQIIAKFDTKEQAINAAERVYEKIQQEKADEKRQSNTRKYVDRRENGRDVTAQELQDAFGFRGVNFGNWVNQKERQQFINNTYDSLFDLAELLDLPPKALSLNGELGIAFGAQGHGGKAAAHYIPAFKEINLTKEHGAGSLAHEWWHALDNYFGNQASNKEFSENWSLSLKDKGELRPELFEAFQNLQKQIKEAPFTEEDIKNREKKLIAQTERSIERYANYIKNDFAKEKNATELNNIIDDLVKNKEKYKNYTIEQMQEIESKFFKLVPEKRDTIANRGELNWLTSEIRRLGNIEEIARKGSNKSKYLEDAEKLDKQSGTKYWAEDTELGARAFSVWLFDKMETQNIINRFLVRQEKSSLSIDENTFKQFAAGKEDNLNFIAKTPIITEEKQRIFDAYDKLFDTIEYEETDNGYKLYQLKNSPKQKKIVRGSFDYITKAIEITQHANYSTLPHELAHYWLDNMWSYYRSGKASEAYSNNFKGVLDWLGVDEESQTYFTKGQHEKFADGYVKYLKNGYAPNGLVQGAFDDYDKWLENLYNGAKKLKVKLTPDAIEFFDTMTTGELPEYDVPETQAQIREKNIEQMNKDIETARKFVVEKQTQYNNYDGGNVITKDTVPVTTEGEKKQSKAYTNQASILGIAEQLNYNKADIAEQNKLASEYVKNNLDEARQVVNGEKEAPNNILKNAIYNAYLKEMLAIGDNEAYVNALKNQSLELTRAGQEIASQRGAIENIFDSAYWIRRIENLKKSKLAGQKFGGVTGQETEQALSKMNDFIKNKVEAVMPEFMKAEPEQQKKIAEKLSKEIAAEFKVKPDTKLYQTMYEPSEVRTRTNAYNYIYRYINGALGLDLTREQYNEIIAKTMAIQKSIETTRNRNGNPSALFFKNISEMESYANSIEPSPALAILTSTVGRGNMLFSPKTIALNIESNIVNFFTEAITRRIQNGAVNMAVDSQVIKDYLAYSREVFNTSGYQVSSMPSLDPTTQILSEKMTTTAGDRVVDKLGRFFEQTIFKYGLGAPDLFFKDMTFVDTANILATKEAKGDTKKATELFKDICLIEPKTAKGKELREIAINEALIATYQNKGKTSDLALGIRNAINKASGSANLGDMLSPFVKTPANVIGLGFDYSMGGLVALKNIQTIYNDIQNGTFTDTTRKSLRSLARNGIGFVAAAMIASMIDDDDYIPEYALLDQKQRELVKMKGGVFNSVKIGNKYISLDYFGPLAMPLVSFLNAKRGYDAKNKVWNYFQGSAYQALKLPVIGDIKSLLEGTGRTLTKDVNENIKMAEDAAIDFVSSRSIPAIVTDIAKMTDEYERETNNKAINRLKSKVPILRDELPMQYNYGTGRARETQNPVSQLFAGARIKDEVSSPVIRELDKLSEKNTEEKINIAKVTKAGKLSSLSDEKKNKVEKEFAKLYAQNVGALIKSPQYKALDDNEKIKNINKIRALITDKLKEDYGLNDKTKKPRTKRIVNKNNIQL